MQNMNWEYHTIEPIDFKNRPSVNAESIQKECDSLSSVLIKKNHDYGNSVQKQFQKYGLSSILIRLDDKLSRLDNLLENNQMVSDESILDTLQDLAGYALLGKICVQSEQKKQAVKPGIKKPSYMDIDDEY
jgi:hypothetical protein